MKNMNPAILNTPLATAGNRKGLHTSIIFASVAVIAIASVWTAVVLRAPASPNNDAVKLAKVASSAEFASASPEKQRQWMLSMNDRQDQIVTTYRAGRLTEQEFQAAMNLAWMAKQEDHMAKYYRLAAGKERDEFLDKLAKKHFEAKDAAKADPSKDDGFDHDEVWEQSWISKWPQEKRAQYEAFRKARDEHRETWKLANRPKKDKPTTKPAGK